MTGYPSPSTPDPLHIVCPPSKQPVTVAVSCAGLFVVAMAATRLVNGPAERFSWFKVWLLVLVGTACVALIYRNLFVRDELVLYRHKPEEGEREDEDRLILAASSVRSVRVCPPPGPFSVEAKNAEIGMKIGLIEIETLDGSYRFGAGLDENISRATARQIADYCGLREAGSQWKAVTAET